MNTFDKTLRLLTLIAATFTVILSVKAVVDNGLGSWVSTSAGLFIAVLIASLLKTYNKGQVNFFGLIGALFAQLTLGRIFSTIHLESIDISMLSSLDPLMVAETGPGIPSIELTSTLLFVLLALQLIALPWRSKLSLTQLATGKPDHYAWGMTLVRIYVGLMFIAHFTGHLLVGGNPFAVFADYFGSIGLPFPEAFVILAGIIEISLAIMLSFGLFTRLAGFGSAVYLFVSVGLGGHYSVGYVWVLPTGGWEFPAMWIFVSGIFMLAGGGKLSLDYLLRKKLGQNSISLPEYLA
ncbi:DoxX family protein [Vibrio barjaei]|uniref:DoxX family protein n=1 Tax=Vibrio barjaei TaxID=1676683 RepID=A0ABW7IPF7_9VIBR